MGGVEKTSTQIAKLEPEIRKFNSSFAPDATVIRPGSIPPGLLFALRNPHLDLRFTPVGIGVVKDLFTGEYLTEDEALERQSIEEAQKRIRRNH